MSAVECRTCACRYCGKRRVCIPAGCQLCTTGFYRLKRCIVMPVACPACAEDAPRYQLEWTYDRYGIPYKKVCRKCYDRVQAKIGEFVHDPTYAGEELEPR